VVYVIQLIIGLVCAYICYTMALKKGYNAVLFAVLGFFFSIITLIVILVLKPKPGSPAAAP
jgi:hypothetical protein